MGRPLWGPFYSGYSFGHGYGDYNGYGAYGWSGGPNSVIVFNNSDQSREGMLEQPLDAPPQWPVGAAALPMPIGYAPSPYGWVAQSGAMGFPEGMPPIIFAPPQQPADLVVVDFPPGSRVLR